MNLPSHPSVARYLEIQGLQVDDLEANRAGTVSPRQAAIAATHRRKTTTAFLFGFGTFFVSALCVAFTFSEQSHEPLIFVAAAVALALAGIAYGIYAAVWRIPSLAGRKVELVEGRAERVRYLATRDEFDVRMNGVRYTGFGRLDSAFDGLLLKMYVVPDKKIVVGIEQPGDARQYVTRSGSGIRS